VEPPTPLASVEPDKQITNGLQTDHKEITEQITNGLQTDHKEITPSVSAAKPTPPQNEKRITQRITSERVNGSQTDHKEITTSRLETLRGLEARLLHFIFQECRAAGDLLSPPITLERISTYLPSHKRAAKTVIFRLVEKKFITREGGATGRGGFTRFRLEKSLYQSLLLRETDHKEITNGLQTDHKEASKRITQRITSPSSSSSFLDSDQNLKTTTTGEPELFDDTRVQLSPDWAAIDTSPLAEIGFTQTHLMQLAKHSNLSAAEVQDSIHFFAFDLRRNGKGRELKGPPLNFFMGILRKGLPYAAPENYENPETEARRQYLESKRRLEEQRLAEERELQDLEFAEWRRGVSPEDVNAIVPEVVRHIPKAREMSLKTYFDESVWPARRAGIPGVLEAERAEISRQVEQSLGEIQP
jgi:hypothetical protein